MSTPPSTLPRDLARGAVVFLWLAMLAWARPLMLPDEGRYVGVAWEMVRSHDWLTPTLNGLPYFHKPPLFYWITASALSVFGPHELPARLASLFGAWCGAMSLFIFVRRWSGERLARITLAVLLCQPLFYLGAQFANLDMLVAGLITATTCLLADAALSFEAKLPFRWSLGAAYAVAALGLLAKGLIGFVLPALAIGLWLVWRRRWRTLWAMVWLPGMAVCVLLAAPWVVAMQQRFPSFLDYFVVVQHFQRFSGSGFNNGQPLWFYPVALAFLTLPWLPWLRPRAGHEQQAAAMASPLRSLFVAWCAVVVGFFSIPHSKLIGYVLPAVPPLAALIAEGIAIGMARTGARALNARVAASAACSLLVAFGVIAWLAVHPIRSTKLLAQDLRDAWVPGQPVVMLEDYYFDVPFYAALKAPVAIFDDWGGPDAQRDNWRKELADAGVFDPVTAHRVLRPRTDLVDYLCRQRQPVLVLGAVASAGSLGLPTDAGMIARRGDMALWRWRPAPASSVMAPAACAGRPNAG